MLNTTFTPDLLQQLARNEADVLLVDLEDGEALQKEYLDALFEQLDLPIVFSDSDISHKNGQSEEELGRNLYNKLTSLFSRSGKKDKGSTDLDMAVHRDGMAAAHYDRQQPPRQAHKEIIGSRTSKSGTPANRVWVLTGSMGGIEAIRRFLSTLPDDLPISFIVAQYLSESIVAQAARLIATGNAFNVTPAQSGQVIRYHDVIVLPVIDETLRINDKGEINRASPLSSEEISYAIDGIMTAVAKRYGRDAGAIVFSGVGRVGIDGCRAIIDHGGVVWTQDAESSRYASMPQYVRDACEVSFTATPESLAHHLADNLHAIDAKRTQQIAT